MPLLEVRNLQTHFIGRGTVAKAVCELLEIERPLRYSWSLEAFTGGDVPRQREPDPADEHHHTNLELIDQAIKIVKLILDSKLEASNEYTHQHRTE
jgi:hypothetical protein